MRERPTERTPRPADHDMIERDRTIVTEMAENGLMPLQYMEQNMRWYQQRAIHYEDEGRKLARPESFRNHKRREEQRSLIKHYEAMALKMRALGEAAAEAAANYSHAKIQSVSVGGRAGNKPVVLLFTGADARL